MEVVAVAARRDMVSSMMTTLRRAGLKPVGIDLAAFAMIRALPADGEEATLYCNLGDVTNLAIARGAACMFTRVSPYGIEAIAQRLAERREISLDDARVLVSHSDLGGSDAGSDEERAARETLREGTAKLSDEIKLSLEYYATQDGVPAVEKVVVCGPGSTIPGLPESLGEGLGHSLEAASPGALDGLDDATAARLTTSYGLALED